MREATSVNGIRIRLPPERWRHITERHPEMAERLDEVLNALGLPDLVQEGDSGTLLAIRRQEDGYLVVVYREMSSEDGFVITAYYTRVLRSRRIAWMP